MDSKSAVVGTGTIIIVVAAAGVVTTIQAGIIALLYRKCAKLTRKLHELQWANSQSVLSLRSEIVGLRNIVNLLERRIAESRAGPLSNSAQNSQRIGIGRVASVNSVSEGEYADAVDDPDFFRTVDCQGTQGIRHQ
uniref:Col_cuticle_N domain-containing protein n=1 Tax=Globodera pallida TaxID=36090 RepID=A0A183BQF3_GLOPA